MNVDVFFLLQFWKRRAGKKTTLEKKNEKWLWLSKELGTSLKGFFQSVWRRLREGGPLLALSLLPSLNMNPIEQKRWSDGNKALTGLSCCLSAGTQTCLWLSWQQATQEGPPKTPPPPTLLFTSTHSVNASFTCCTLGTTSPPLAAIRGHGQLDTQSLTAAGRMVDWGVHNLIDGVKQTGDVLHINSGRGYVNISMPKVKPYRIHFQHCFTRIPPSSVTLCVHCDISAC